MAPFDFGMYAPIVFEVFHVLFIPHLPLGFRSWGPQVPKEWKFLRQYFYHTKAYQNPIIWPFGQTKVACNIEVQQLSNGVLLVWSVIVTYKSCK